MRSNDEVRRQLAQTMGKPVSDELWRDLKGEQYLPVYDDHDFNNLVREAARRSARRKRSGSAENVDGEPFDPRLSGREQRRAAAVRQYFAKHAAENELVRRFREDVLDGRLLDDVEAAAFLESWANRTFTLKRFQREGVRPAEHHANLIVRTERSNERFRTTIEVEGRMWRHEHVQARDARAWNTTRTDGSWEFRVQTRSGTILGIFRAHSVIGFLEYVARDLRVQGYPWAEHSHGWFVLTGNDLAVSPLDARTRLVAGEATQRATIRLELEPWINHRTVADLYRRYQRHLLQGHNRPIEDRRLALFRFVTDQRGEDGRLPTWRSMMQLWNETMEHWQYRDPRNFQRDASEAERLLLWPNYRYLANPKEAQDGQACQR